MAAARRIDTDVLVLQESWAPHDGPASHDQIAAALGYDVAAWEPLGLGALDGPRPRTLDRARGTRPRPRRGQDGLEPTGSWGLAVLSRRTVLRTDVTPLVPQLRTDASSRSLLRVEVDVDHARLAIHATHMAHLHMGSIRHAPLLRRTLAATDGPAILIGDLNMWAWCTQLYVPRRWRRRGTGRTYPAPKPWARIDHLVVNPHVQVLDAEVLPDLGSDHRPIRARLSVP